MEKTVKRFLDLILDQATPLMATLNKGATDQQVADFEREMNITLPADVRKLYQTFNGQKAGENDNFFLDGMRFIPLEEIKRTQQHWLEQLQEIPNWQSLRFDEEEAIDMCWDKVVKNQFYNPKWIPFLSNGACFMFIDLDPDKNGVVGQIGEIDLVLDSIEDSFLDLINESINEWLDFLSDDIEQGIVTYSNELHTLLDVTPPFDEDLPNIFAPTPDYVSEGGSNVYNYSEKDRSDFVFPDRSCVYMDEICDHLEKYIGKVDSVFHELISEYVHIDVHWIKPTPETPYHVLFTTGMSDYPMYLPEGLEDPNDYSHAELMVYLPESWPISDEAFKDDDNYWPVYFLKMIARFPHQYKTWMAEGHTIPNGPDAEPIANTNFGCILLMPPYLSAPQDFLKLQTKDGTIINFYSILPIYPEEMDLKLEEGVDELLNLFDEYEISEVIDIHRKNVAL